MNHHRKIMNILFAVVCAACLLTTAAATQPQYSALRDTQATLELSHSGRAVCIAWAVAWDSGLTVEAKMELCRLENGKPTVVSSWNYAGSYQIDAEEARYVATGHSYQVVVTATVKDSSGKILEEGTAYSDIKKC